MQLGNFINSQILSNATSLNYSLYTIPILYRFIYKILPNSNTTHELSG
jgi:hypothetical protein